MKTMHLGKVLGAFGLLLLLSSPFTFFLTSGSAWVTSVKAGLGLVLIAAYFATNYRQLGQFASRKSSFFFVSSALFVIAVLGALVAINYIAAQRNKSWDLTQRKIFTLAPQTLSLLRELKEPVQALAFMPATHPYYGSVELLFARYHNEAPHFFNSAFKDPRKHPDLAAQYALKEGQTPIVLIRGEGAKASHLTLNVLSEQELTNALLKLNAVGEQKVYFLAGHGEWPLSLPPEATGAELPPSLSELAGQLTQEGYVPQSLNLAGQSQVPKDAAVLVIAGAKTPYTAPERAVLEKYLAEGGRLLYFAEANAHPQLDALLAQYGVQVDEGLVTDAQFNSGSPYVVLSLFYAEHPIVQLLQQLQLNIELPTARALTVLREGLASGVKVMPVALSSPVAWVESTPDDRPTRGEGEKSGQLALVTASTRDTAQTPDKRFDEARVVVLGDSELLLDTNWGHEANRNLVMNALGWATNQVNKITVRPPDRDISTLNVSAEWMDRVRFVSTDLLPLSLFGVGLAVWLTRRNK